MFFSAALYNTVFIWQRGINSIIAYHKQNIRLGYEHHYSSYVPQAERETHNYK